MCIIHKSDLGDLFSAHIISSHGHTSSIFLPVFIQVSSRSTPYQSFTIYSAVILGTKPGDIRLMRIVRKYSKPSFSLRDLVRPRRSVSDMNLAHLRFQFQILNCFIFNSFQNPSPFLTEFMVSITLYHEILNGM